MKFVHTSDWHLGRILFGRHLTEDQRHVLEGFLEDMADLRPRFVILAGDVYDRAVPPPEAVTLLDEVLTRLVVDLRIAVVLLAGNHDSPERVGFGSRLLEAGGLHLAGRLTAEPAVATFVDDDVTVHVAPLPYCEAPEIRAVLGRPDLTDPDEALTTLLDAWRACLPGEGRRVLASHLFVAGGSSSESERPVGVGGAGTVGTACFQGFDHVALGHLHRPQTMDEGRIRYAGSLMTYSFSEAAVESSYDVVELGPEGPAVVEHRPFRPLRRLRLLTGRFEDLTAAAATDPRPDDYVQVQLTDPEPVVDAKARLETVYPNVLSVVRSVADAPEAARPLRGDHRQTDPGELFEGFFQAVTGTPLSDDEKSVLGRVLDGLRAEEREADR